MRKFVLGTSMLLLAVMVLAVGCNSSNTNPSGGASMTDEKMMSGEKMMGDEKMMGGEKKMGDEKMMSGEKK